LEGEYEGKTENYKIQTNFAIITQATTHMITFCKY